MCACVAIGSTEVIADMAIWLATAVGSEECESEGAMSLAAPYRAAEPGGLKRVALTALAVSFGRLEPVPSELAVLADV